MTKRIPTSIIQNLWHDAQRVDKNDLEVEQNYTNQTNAAIVNNFFGSGVLINSPSQPILFDSGNLDVISAALLSANKFDGTGINVILQPSDINLGNQIEIELSGSGVFGRLSTKVLIIGLAFDGSLIYERFTFHRNEKQVSKNHYKKILTLMFNDFMGNNNCSINNGGRIVVREAFSFELSHDCLTIAQDVEPNIFFRDFKVADGYIGLYRTLAIAVTPLYNADDLRINITSSSRRIIGPNDVVSQVGQKFKATTNNIQKVTFLMGAYRDDTVPIANRFNWSGNLIVSIFKISQTTSCPTDIIPDLAIDFDPEQFPIVEVSFSQIELADEGIVLTDIAQPVDFIFNSTKIANAGGIIPGSYYAVTFRRSGSSNSGTIFAEAGTNLIDNSRSTTFNNVWVDTNEEDLWFQIWSDAVKISDGISYFSGNGIQFDKTTIDVETGATIDDIQRNFSFESTGQGSLNIGVIQSIEKDSVTVQDERTGNSVDSRKNNIPNFSFVDSVGLTQLQNVSDALIIGAVVDNNPKTNPNLIKTQNFPGLAKNDTFIIINPDPDLLSLQLVGSKFYPNISTAYNYRIFKVTLCTDGYGHVLGNDTISTADLARATQLIGESVYLNTTQAKILAGTISTLELFRCDVDGDGYITTNDVNLIQNYINRSINSFPVGSSFNHLTLQCQQSSGRWDGYMTCGPPGVYENVPDGYSGGNKVLISSLDPIQVVYDGYLSNVIINIDPAFSVIPFSPINYKIKFQPFWQDYLVILDSSSRQLPTTFTNSTGIVANNCSITNPFVCTDRVGLVPKFDSGRNDYFVPDNFIIGKGEILRPDGSNYKVDFEVSTIILELPATPINKKTINIADVFIIDRGNGLTTNGYKCLRYADCSTVKPEDLINNKIKFSISIQSINNSLNVVGATVQDLTGIYLDLNGVLTISNLNSVSDPIFNNLRSRLLITVYLKKGGFNNSTLVVLGNEVAGLFG